MSPFHTCNYDDLRLVKMVLCRHAANVILVKIIEALYKSTSKWCYVFSHVKQLRCLYNYNDQFNVMSTTFEGAWQCVRHRTKDGRPSPHPEG